MGIKVYSTGCPRCEILKKKLDIAGIEFEICDDVDEMNKLGILSVPVLEVNGERFSFAQSIGKIKDIECEGRYQQ